MRPSITTSYLGGLWLAAGLLVAFGGIVTTALALAISLNVLHIEPSSLRPPLDFIARNALMIGPLQFLVGLLLSIGGFLLMRKSRPGRWIIQSLTLALMLWFLLLGIHTYRAAKAERPVLFPAIVPAGLALIALGASVWALNRPSITAELASGK